MYYEICVSVSNHLVPFLQLGGFFIWTYTYQLIRNSATKYYGILDTKDVIKVPNKELDADKETHLLKREDQEEPGTSPSQSIMEDVEKQVVSVVYES